MLRLPKSVHSVNHDHTGDRPPGGRLRPVVLREPYAANLGISADAVNQHLDAIRRKLGAVNRTEAVAIALKKHLLKS